MKKKYDVVGIGNAIVDILANVEDEFLDQYGLIKSITAIIDETRAIELGSALASFSEVAGGSVANSMAGLASFGSRVAYIGKVRDDEYGKAFEMGMKSCGVDPVVKFADQGISTARCVVLVTPDAQRTMNTYLGISKHLGPEDVDYDVIRNSSIAYLEGYLWYQEEAKKAIKEIIKISHKAGNKIALSLSDPFCVDLHRKEFLDLVRNHADVIFANEDEIRSLFEVESLKDALNCCKKIDAIFAITKGADGSVIVHKNDVYEVPIKPVSKLIDTTGAGDMYAAGFLHAFAKGCDLLTCGKFGSIAAAEIVGHFGARPEVELKTLV